MASDHEGRECIRSREPGPPFTSRRLPVAGNSENIGSMKSLAALRCLVIATTAVLTATLPVIGTAQETLPAEAPAAPPSIPQPRFVTDKLVLNVYAEPDQDSSRVATIQTGDAVEELERAGNLVRVRLEDGREGWVGASYLVSDPPAIVRLRELQRQQPAAAPRVDKASMEEIAQLKKENTALRRQVGELQSRVTSLAAAPTPSERNIETPVPEASAEAAALASTAPRGGVVGWLIALMFVGAVSYAGGYQTLARRLRKKFGGLKIY